MYQSKPTRTIINLHFSEVVDLFRSLSKGRCAQILEHNFSYFSLYASYSVSDSSGSCVSHHRFKWSPQWCEGWVMRISLAVSCPSFSFALPASLAFPFTHTLSAAHTGRERIGTLSTFSTFFTFPFEGLSHSPHHIHSIQQWQTSNVSHNWAVLEICIFLYVSLLVICIRQSGGIRQPAKAVCVCCSVYKGVHFFCQSANLYLSLLPSFPVTAVRVVSSGSSSKDDWV